MRADDKTQKYVLENLDRPDVYDDGWVGSVKDMVQELAHSDSRTRFRSTNHYNPPKQGRVPHLVKILDDLNAKLRYIKIDYLGNYEYFIGAKNSKLELSEENASLYQLVRSYLQSGQSEKDFTSSELMHYLRQQPLYSSLSAQEKDRIEKAYPQEDLWIEGEEVRDLDAYSVPLILEMARKARMDLILDGEYSKTKKLTSKFPYDRWSLEPNAPVVETEESDETEDDDLELRQPMVNIETSIALQNKAVEMIVENYMMTSEYKKCEEEQMRLHRCTASEVEEALRTSASELISLFVLGNPKSVFIKPPQSGKTGGVILNPTSFNSLVHNYIRQQTVPDIGYCLEELYNANETLKGKGNSCEFY